MLPCLVSSGCNVYNIIPLWTILHTYPVDTLSLHGVVKGRPSAFTSWVFVVCPYLILSFRVHDLIETPLVVTSGTVILIERKEDFQGETDSGFIHHILLIDLHCMIP